MLKKGYKQTEVGVIPEDWTVQSFADTFRILNNNTFSRAELNYVSGQFKNIHYGDILIRFPEVLDCTRDDVPYINDEARISESAQVLQNGDIVMADTAEDETVGKVTEVMNTSKKPVLSGLHTIPCRVKVGEFVPKWLGYYMNSHLYHDQLLPYIHGTKVSSVSKSSLGGTAIIVPTAKEQERIVEALSDIDALIDNLEKLIEKKKKIKQGTMKELLTGKKRLPGFVESWNTINLSKNSKIKARIGWQGLTTAEYQQNDNSLLVTGTDFKDGKILWSNCHYVSKERFNQDTNIQIKNNDILITKDGTIGKVAIVERLEKPATLNSGVFVVRPNNKSYYPQFLYYILLSFVFRDFLDKLSAGSTIVHLYQKDLVGFEFEAPPTIEEQTAIANLLSDMDEEITALNKKLAKTKLLKQGMMQKLLTGEIRLLK